MIIAASYLSDVLQIWFAVVSANNLLCKWTNSSLFNW